MSTSTRALLGVSVVMLLLLIGNYRFAEQLYPDSFRVQDNVVTFNVRGSDAAESFAFPEDRVGAVLSVLFIACLIAYVLQYKNDVANRDRKSHSLKIDSDPGRQAKRQKGKPSVRR
ncbi:MAG: hypothetical protein LAO31_12885 [Acidobacteriia bacterium]|nr:hypothetical protein [Terriglobia bacterium]